MNLLQESDVSLLEKLADQALASYPEKVIEYRKGKKGLMGLFVGEVMKLSKGKRRSENYKRIAAKKIKRN
jgi:aspartyl-tRNA(Asn)/glutamyl-tRNA(Gln) amidotransferase subunit B